MSINTLPEIALKMAGTPIAEEEGDTMNIVTETLNDFEIFCSPRTLMKKLVTCKVIDDKESVRFEFSADDFSDVIIHILEGGNESEQFIRLKSGCVVAIRDFMYTSKYIKCKIMPNGQLHRSLNRD